MAAKIFFAAIAQPYPQRLRYLLAFDGRQALIERQCVSAFTPARAIVVSVPETAGHSDATTRFLQQGCAFQGFVGWVVFCRH